MPKIEVTDGSTNQLPQTTAGASNNEQKISVAGLGCDLSLDYTSAVKRSSSLSAASSSRKLKEVNRFKTFKTFVESKILSKSDRSLDGPGNDSGAQPPSASKSLHVTNGNPVSSTVLSARDNFLRRSSISSRGSYVEVIHDTFIQIFVSKYNIFLAAKVGSKSSVPAVLCYHRRPRDRACHC